MGERPRYYDGDYYCSKCGEPWDAYGVRIALKGEVSDMTQKEAKQFMKGLGCPCCPRETQQRNAKRKAILSHVPESSLF